MHPRAWTLAIASCLLACSGGAPPPTTTAPPSTLAAPAVAPEPPPVPTRPSWLYEVHTTTQSSYVFAALEPGCPLHESFPPDYAVLFRFARTVIVTDAQTEEEARASLLANGVDRSGSLERVLGPERFAVLAHAIDDLVPGEIVRFMRPVWAVMMLQLPLAASAYGADASDGRLSPTHDAVSRRRMAGAPIVGLFEHDDVDAEIARLAPLATEVLRAELDHVDDLRAAARAALAAYRAGDEAALEAVHANVPGTGRFAALAESETRRHFESRIADVETELRTGNALVLLPVDLTLGERGLLARLHADGFEITRVEVPAPP